MYSDEYHKWMKWSYALNEIGAALNAACVFEVSSLVIMHRACYPHYQFRLPQPYDALKYREKYA